MKKLHRGALAIALHAATSFCACENVLSPSHQTPVLASGWQGQLIANGFTKPRSIHFDTAGSLIVLDSGVGVRRVRLEDKGDTCLSVTENELLIDDTELNHGLALSADGKTLYASTVSSVHAYSYDPQAGKVSPNPRTVISGMSNNDHTTRTLLMSRRSPGRLIVSRGSDENFDVDALDLSSGVSQIRVFDLNKLGDGDTYDFNTQGRVLGWGLRNSVGVDEDPRSGNVYSVETSVDEITRDGVNIEENNPGEELNFHGKADERGDVGNYGYPYCYPLWDTDVPDNEGLRVGDVFSVTQNSTFNDTTCQEEYVPPRLVFPAHTSPLGLLFSEDGETLYISFRGSFNPKNPVGYMVSSVAFSDGQPVERVSSNTALSDVMTNPDLSRCPDECFRPVGLAWDKEGRLWVTSDSTGEIYVLKRTGAGGSGSGGGKGTFVTGSDESRARGRGVAVGVAGAAVVLAGLIAF
ncbi:related to L-sorbosone dehydrogenase [Cephalotrichum gorgonifer]|uniref:Related to L-sorbosone dehydrogenase n=1 Tax=Cephalotrichum gorgonifer TaxID=2041049 RepID=A0AAE8N9A6_9PEZI|nr:related to L-sorbosone dehydrogenase [Cephalotrichum gorgonifer]